jgi:hypothetical protein
LVHDVDEFVCVCGFGEGVIGVVEELFPDVGGCCAALAVEYGFKAMVVGLVVCAAVEDEGGQAAVDATAEGVDEGAVEEGVLLLRSVAEGVGNGGQEGVPEVAVVGLEGEQALPCRPGEESSAIGPEGHAGGFSGEGCPTELGFDDDEAGDTGILVCIAYGGDGASADAADDDGPVRGECIGCGAQVGNMAAALNVAVVFGAR